MQKNIRERIGVIESVLNALLSLLYKKGTIKQSDMQLEILDQATDTQEEKDETAQ